MLHQIVIFFITIFSLHLTNGYYQRNEYRSYEDVLFAITLGSISYVISSTIFFLFYFLIKRVYTKNTYYNLPLKRYVFLIIYGILTTFVFGFWILGTILHIDNSFNELVYDNMESSLALSVSFIQFVIFRLVILSSVLNQKTIA